MADTADGQARDLVEVLLEDHKAAKALLARVGAVGEDQSALFDELVHDLVGHEVAEEEIVYPALRAEVPSGDALAEPRIAEQQKAEELLAKMEGMDRSGADFAQSLAHLRDEVLAHAQAEETEVFPELRQHLSDERSAVLATAYRTAKATAPTHPHPHAPNTPPGNIAAGGIAAVADRVRDAARSAMDKLHSHH